ncbi:MAG: FAD-binding oxidoreductase [Desulfobacterota bacterium]|nr:FAD-binding oxidoreductase [Thermodesulfobacteriota bacterium]
METIKRQLENIVGFENVMDDRASLMAYAQDQSFVPRCMPDAVVFVQTVEQIRKIVRWAHENRMPLIPYSSGKNLHGAAVPTEGGVVINMTRMNTILCIDDENWFAVIEPGVTYQQLQAELEPRGFRIMVPFGVPPDRSVLTSYLERDVAMAAPSFESGNALVLDMEIVLPDGEIFRTGNWACGGNPGSPYGPVRMMAYRLWTAAQGTLGIVTKMAVAIDRLPPQRKVFFLPFQELATAVHAIARIQRREIGTECFLLNRFNLAALFCEGWQVPRQYPTSKVSAETFDFLRQALPPWVATICVNGLPYYPEEKIAYESEALYEVCAFLSVPVLEELPGVCSAAEIMLQEMLRPWGILKKFNYRGAVHDVTFKAPLDSVPDLIDMAYNIAQDHDYPGADIGVYMLPLERGRAVHCEIDFHSQPDNENIRERIKALWFKTSQELIKRGAYFDRPYGAWANMVYNRAATYTLKLREIKQKLDPNGIFNPGKLCF